MNNNRTDESALLAATKGVFSKTSYISLGNKEQPEPYGVKDKLRSNYTGKQFITIRSKQGKTPNTYFEKKHNWISEGDKFIDRTKYAEAQKEKQKGFLTGDFHRRDEFSNTIRTEQWREQLQKEKKFSSLMKSPSMDSSTYEQDLEPSSVPDQVVSIQSIGVLKNGVGFKFLYDRVFEKPDLMSNGAGRTRRDTNNPTALTKERNFGGMRTTYNLTHKPPMRFEKPEHAHKPIIRDTFYRKMNIPLVEN